MHELQAGGAGAGPDGTVDLSAPRSDEISGAPAPKMHMTWCRLGGVLLIEYGGVFMNEPSACEWMPVPGDPGDGFYL